MVHGICSRLYKDIHDSGFTAIESCDSRFYVSFKCWSTAKAKNEKSNEIVQLFKCSIEDLPALAMPAAFKAGTTMPVTSIPDEPPTFSVDENPALIDGEDATSQPQLSIDKKTWLHGWLQQSESASWLALPCLTRRKEGLVSYPSSQQPDRRKQTVIHPGCKKSMFLKSARLVPLPFRVTGAIICPSCGGDGQDGRGVWHGKQAKLVA